jgi:hypothetical protein
MTDEHQLDADFAAFGDHLITLPEFRYPSMDRLPYIAVDIIARHLHLDIHDDDVPLSKKLAANEWFWRRANGQKVTFDQVYRAGTLSGMDAGNGTRPQDSGTSPAAPNDTASSAPSPTHST